MAGGGLRRTVANWSDADGDKVSLVGIGSSTNGVPVTDDAETLLCVNTNNVNDLLICRLASLPHLPSQVVTEIMQRPGDFIRTAKQHFEPEFRF